MEEPINRRKVLSIVASLFDPLGCVAPFVLKGKVILQQMCREDVEWDQTLPTHLKPKWDAWLCDLETLHTLQIPRCFVTPNFGTTV